MEMALFVSLLCDSAASHEFAIAKRFDKDEDGILNPQERKECLDALKNGYEKTLYWTEDHNDPTLNLRVIQKSGKIFLPDSVHNEGLTGSQRQRRTKSYMDEKRKFDRIQENKE